MLRRLTRSPPYSCQADSARPLGRQLAGQPAQLVADRRPGWSGSPSSSADAVAVSSRCHCGAERVVPDVRVVRAGGDRPGQAERLGHGLLEQVQRALDRPRGRRDDCVAGSAGCSPAPGAAGPSPRRCVRRARGSAGSSPRRRTRPGPARGWRPSRRARRRARAGAGGRAPRPPGRAAVATRRRLTASPTTTPTVVSSSRLVSRLDWSIAFVASTTMPVVAMVVDSSAEPAEPTDHERGGQHHAHAERADAEQRHLQAQAMQHPEEGRHHLLAAPGHGPVDGGVHDEHRCPRRQERLLEAEHVGRDDPGQHAGQGGLRALGPVGQRHRVRPARRVPGTGRPTSLPERPHARTVPRLDETSREPQGQGRVSARSERCVHLVGASGSRR